MRRYALRLRSGQALRHGSGQALRLRSGQAQTTMELAAAMAILMMLLVASVRVFVWLNERIVKQQKAYEATRALAGGSEQINMAESTLPTIANIMNMEQTEGEGNLYTTPYEPLNIFADPE
jgi:hypothetical protein